MNCACERQIEAIEMMKMRGEGGGAQEYGALAAEARNYVWMGAIPLHVELHKDEIVILPAPPPFMVPTVYFIYPFRVLVCLLARSSLSSSELAT